MSGIVKFWWEIEETYTAILLFCDMSKWYVKEILV